MTGSTSLVILLMLLAAVFVWLLARTRRGGRCRLDDDIDHEVLEQAEQELSDLDALATPEDADDHLPDWGPGAPK